MDYRNHFLIFKGERDLPCIYRVYEGNPRTKHLIPRSKFIWPICNAYSPWEFTGWNYINNYATLKDMLSVHYKEVSKEEWIIQCIANKVDTSAIP